MPPPANVPAAAKPEVIPAALKPATLPSAVSAANEPTPPIPAPTAADNISDIGLSCIHYFCNTL